MVMSILVTGGTGFIGSHTVVELLQAGYDVVIADNLCNSKKTVLDRIERITGKMPKFYLCDLCDREALEAIFIENKDIEAVIHFAGLKAVGESVALPLLYYRNNFLSTLVLLECMQKFGVKRIVFSSSATVYGAPKEVPIKETADLQATNPYGQTKLTIELILRDACVADKDLCASVLRYFNPIGAHSSGLIGEDPKGIPNNLVPYVAKVACGKLPCVNVFGNDYPTHDGTGVRDYIHVVDLAKAHLAALKWTEKAKGIDYFNIGTGVGYSVLDIISEYSKACEKELPYKIADRRPGDISTCYADATKAREVLGWEAKLGLDAMCSDSNHWQSMNPDGYPDE